MTLTGRCLVLAGLTATTLTNGAPAAEPIRSDQFGALQKLIKPDATEDAWSTIPWLTDLWQARKLAAQHGKPIVLWEMDGHPLGCT